MSTASSVNANPGTPKKSSGWRIDTSLTVASKTFKPWSQGLCVEESGRYLTEAGTSEKLIEYHSEGLVAACSAEAELALRRADRSGLIKYTPGQEKFTVVDEAQLSLDQRKAIEYIEHRVIYKYMRTGIQHALNTVAFKLLRRNMVYPVSDENRYTDGEGNVLPDAHLMPNDATPKDLAETVHTRLAEDYILAIDARTGLRLPRDYVLRHRDVVKIMTQKRSKAK